MIGKWQPTVTRRRRFRSGRATAQEIAAAKTFHQPLAEVGDDSHRRLARDTFNTEAKLPGHDGGTIGEPYA